MNKKIMLALSASAVITMLSCTGNNYSGKSWNNTLQQIPGDIECEYYDLGGEGVAYHDTDSINNGSGRLNPVNGNYLHEFRLNEGVDISYTKSNDIDNNNYNLVNPEMNHLYVGWTKPEEWINYTIEVQKTAKYKIGLMYTSNGTGGISFLLDGKKLTDVLEIPTTHHDGDTIAWRQWHHWNYVDGLTEVEIKKGTHRLTLHTDVKGDMNYDYISFKEQ
jgi:hypothetical protein